MTAPPVTPLAGGRLIGAARGHTFSSEKVAIDAAQVWLGVVEDQFGL